MTILMYDDHALTCISDTAVCAAPIILTYTHNWHYEM